MSRYIDADALKLDIDLSKGASVLDMALSVIKAVKEAPAADVVSVVRCKDCKYCIARQDYIESFVCTRNNILVYGYSFCSYGKRRSENEKS